MTNATSEIRKILVLILQKLFFELTVPSEEKEVTDASDVCDWSRGSKDKLDD